MPNLRIVIVPIVLLSMMSTASADAPDVPESVAPLAETEIKELLDGKTFQFVAYDEPLTGTSTWNHDKGTVSGTFVFDQEQEGEYEVRWFLKDDLSCIEASTNEPQCQVIYPYEGGFMEVRPDGVVHAVSKPIN